MKHRESVTATTIGDDRCAAKKMRWTTNAVSMMDPAASTRLGEVMLTATERAQVVPVLYDLVAGFDRVDDTRLLREIGGMGYLFPESLRTAIGELRYAESIAGLIVRNGPVADDPGPTPNHWRDRGNTLRHDMWLLWLAAQLGDPACWSVWQDGSLINNVLPVTGEEVAQTGLGSSTEMEFHVEEALYDHRCDGLALACLRNPDAVPTTVASVDCLDLPTLDVDVLCQPRFRIGDDKVFRIRPALFGAPESPYLRLDQPYMAAVPGDERAAAALAELFARLRDGMVDVVLDAGDVLLLDNYRTVHGRRPFHARYDGTDRWLRRCTTTRDLRHTRAQRDGAEGRVITPDIG